jgi:hypothetical protein
MFRHWRIQFSIICLALLSATLVMWWRSYHWFDAYQQLNGNPGFTNFISARGDVAMNVTTLPQAMVDKMPHPNLLSQQMTDDQVASIENSRVKDRGILGFHGHANSVSVLFAVPYWFLAAVFASIAGLPWFGHRVGFKFSLCTFLILCTIVALLVGFVAWQIHPTAKH